MELSVVTSVYKNKETLEDFLINLSEEISTIGIKDYEIIFVIDGSPDTSLEKLISLKDRFKNILIINLSKNFGHHPALLTGIQESKGEFIFVIDCDLEENPKNISKFYNEIKGSNFDIILSQQSTRKGNVINKLATKFSYFIINKILKIDYPKNVLTSTIMTKQFKNALILHKEKIVNFVGLLKITGFQHKIIEISKTQRSKSTYRFVDKFEHFVNVAFTYSNKGVHYLFYFSLLNFVTSLIVVFYFVYKYLTGDILTGYTSLIVSIWFFSSLIILILGIISYYLAIILFETKDRPLTIIKERI